MATQMSSARRGVPTDQMRQVAQDEDVELPWLVRAIASGSVIIPSNTARPQQIHNVGIGKGMKTKVNVNIGTSTLNVDIDAEIEKAHTAYEAYNSAIEKYKNPMKMTEDDFLRAFENNAKDGVDYTTIHAGITKDIAKRIMHVQRTFGYKFKCCNI